ncbi:MAG TPA: serine hydrolase [Chthonomonadaceae bacterium]|nr:serine hydrolase [Chthonomonadaceae bacterium]
MNNPGLWKTIEETERELGGVISLAARDLQTGETLFYKADRKVQTASVIKLPMLVHVALAVQEGRLAWEEPLALTEAEKVDGSGILMQLTAGLTLTLRDVCTLMIVLSDNTATNMVIERIGIEPINARMRALGLKETTLFRKAYSPDTPQSRRYGLGVTTAREMLRLVTLLAEGKIGNAATSADIVSILAGQHYRDCIPRLLPADWQYAGKTGAVDHVRNDVGLLTAPDGRRFGLAVFCQKIPLVLWTADNPGMLAIARLARRLVGLGDEK